MKKPVIAVDLDDVLSNFVEDFLEFTNKKWGTHLTIDDYVEDWATFWKIDKAKLGKRIEWLDKSDIKINVHKDAYVKDVLDRLKARYKLIIVTSRRQSIKKETNAWVETNFKGIFDNVHHAGIWDDLPKDAVKQTKADILKKLGADYLIDDQPKHCIAAAKVGIQSLLYGEYPWNLKVKLPKNIKRVKNWSGVAEYFNV